MVALNESIFHHPGAHGINSGTGAQRGHGRCREFGQSVRYVGSGRSGSSVSNNLLVNCNYDVRYRRRQVIEAATSAVIVTWQFYGPGRLAEVVLGCPRTVLSCRRRVPRTARPQRATRITPNPPTDVSQRWHGGG